MALPQESVAPITTDLRAEELKFDIIKGIEHVNYQDGKLDAGDMEEGDWVVKTATGFAAPGLTSTRAYPVVTGNNRYDSLATGNVTVIVGGNWIYQTKKFVAGVYTPGQALTVKDLGGGEKVPSAAGGTDVICGRVFAYDAVKAILTIEVVSN
jgi:hypothetical protein